MVMSAELKALINEEDVSVSTSAQERKASGISGLDRTSASFPLSGRSPYMNAWHDRDNHRLVTYYTKEGEKRQVKADVNIASRMADEKRKRNAEASVRHRERKKGKIEDQAKQIQGLENERDGLAEDNARLKEDNARLKEDSINLRKLLIQSYRSQNERDDLSSHSQAMVSTDENAISSTSSITAELHPYNRTPHFPLHDHFLIGDTVRVPGPLMRGTDGEPATLLVSNMMA